MAEQSRGNFHLDMSTEELMEWLRERGLGEKDLEVVKANGFLGKSFLLTTEDTWKLGEITAEGQVLLNKLVEEARTEERAEVREVVPSSRANGFLGKSFPLTTEDTWKRDIMGITSEGQILLTKLAKEARAEERAEVREVPSSRDSPGSASGQPPSQPAAPSYERIKLSPSDKPYLNALHDAAYKQGKNKWQNIGMSLNISLFDLESIRKNNPSDVGDCFRAMLLKWFESSPDCHLDTFLKALRSEPVELENLCPKVEEAILKIAFPDQKNLDTASDVGGVGLQELMDHVDTVQLDQVIPDNELPVIAAYFESVELYSAAMGLSAAEQHDVRTTFLQYDTQTAMVRCLRLWKQYRPSMATYRALMELLLKLNRTEVAAQVCQYLAQNVPPHESVKSNQQYEPQISTRTDLLGEDGLSDANQKGVDSYVNFWTGKDVLYVYFLNPDILEQENWKCEYGVLNIDNILAWTVAWNPKNVPNIPIFKKTDRADKADIRVKFEGGRFGTCWATVGSQAMTVPHNEPTMVLSLKGLDPKMQEFLVIHQFGHALGLCHEHQSPNFWKVAKSLLDVRKMRGDPQMKNVNFDKDMLEKQSQDATFKPEYDPDSVMHYWFDVNWLKNEEHTNLSEVEADGNLSEEEKTVLRGIHKRHLSCADGPSKRDLDFLQEIYASIQTSSIQDQRYLRKLDELMSDKKNTIELQYLKMHFIGPSGIGKTTTRKRLVGSITNLSELPEDQRKRCSTFLAECTQVLAFVDLSSGKIKFQRSKDLNEETQLIFSYLMSSKFSKDRTDSTSPAEEGSQASLPSTNSSKETTDEEKQPLKQSDERATEAKTISTKTVPPERKEAVRVSVTAIDVPMVVKRLREIVGGSKDYKESLQNTVLINLVDIGGQPGFMEMFPFLSRGAGIFLAFFRLDKDLDDICQVSYERENDKITPYDSTYTNRETLSQILSAISHYTKIDTDIDRELCSKLGKLGSAEPIAALIGTFKDELAMQIKVDLLYNILCDSRKASNKSDSTTASKSDSTTADKSYSTTADKSDGTTASKTVSTITSKSDSTTADKSDSTTADKSDNTTASKSDSTTANKTTASKRDSITANKTTASKSDSTTADKSDGTTASKTVSTIASKSDSTTADKSDSTTADKSDSTTANSTTASKSDSTTAEHKKAIRLILPQDSQKKSNEQPKVTEQEMAAIKQTISQHLRSDAFKKKVEDRLNQKLDEKSEAMCTITSKFKKLLPTQKDNKKFLAVNNYEGTGSDIDLFCEHLQGMISSFFKDAKLRIRPQQLLLGVVLRDYDIVSMKDCIRIGTEALEMSDEEVRFTVWYLDRFVGALIYRPDIKDGYFEEFVICNPQVVFNSLSALVVKPLLELHSKESSILFTEYVRENWTLRGLFSLKTITKCISEESKEGQLIPVEKLLILLEHSNLLAKIATVKEGHTTDKVETAYFIPAILKCASPEELTKPPPTGIDTPSPIKITFEPQCVPIGIFCAMISELISRGGKGEGILGMTWKLVDSSVKRNLVSFHIDESAKHFVTLIAHVDCYEIRVIRQNRKYTMHELCSYVLSTVVFVMKDISPLLTPIIAFDCYCGKQENCSKLCLLKTGVFPNFTCNCVRPDQKCWFAEEVSMESDVFLLALPFASDQDVKEKNLSFEWSKRRPKLRGTENELEFKATSRSYFNDFISCEISKNQKSFFTVYHCLKELKESVEDASSSETDQLFADVKEVIKEIRSDWYSLAIELDIDYDTRKSIEKDYRWVEPCFEAMLTHWVKRSSPPPSWSAVVRALKSPTIGREDIATSIKENEKATTSPDICRPNPKEPLNVNCHLRVVRAAAWEAKAKWRFVGVQLGIKEGTLDAIEKDYRNESGVCFTKLLEQWLTRSTPAPTLQALIDVLKSPVIDRGDIAQEIESKLT